MRDQAFNEQMLYQYLLGQVTEEESAQIEQRFLGDAEYYQQLLIVEDELRCAYAKGSLPAADREQFEKRFLMFPDERHRVRLAEAMIGELSRTSVVGASQSGTLPQSTNSRLAELLAIFTFRGMAMRLAAGTAIVVILMSLGWFVLERTRRPQQPSGLQVQKTQQPIEQPLPTDRSGEQHGKESNARSQLPEKRAAPLQESPRTVIVSLSLMPGRTRGGAETKRLTVESKATVVRLLLNIESSGVTKYRASILNADGKRVWTLDGLQATRVQNSSVVILTIPARRLAEDDYEINLEGLNATGQFDHVGDYYFTLLKK